MVIYSVVGCLWRQQRGKDTLVFIRRNVVFKHATLTPDTKAHRKSCGELNHTRAKQSKETFSVPRDTPVGGLFKYAVKLRAWDSSIGVNKGILRHRKLLSWLNVMSAKYARRECCVIDLWLWEIAAAFKSLPFWKEFVVYSSECVCRWKETHYIVIEWIIGSECWRVGGRELSGATNTKLQYTEAKGKKVGKNLILRSRLMHIRLHYGLNLSKSSR